jgi:hypothetical protein
MTTKHNYQIHNDENEVTAGALLANANIEGVNNVKGLNLHEFKICKINPNDFYNIKCIYINLNSDDGLNMLSPDVKMENHFGEYHLIAGGYAAKFLNPLQNVRLGCILIADANGNMNDLMIGPGSTLIYDMSFY